MEQSDQSVCVTFMCGQCENADGSRDEWCPWLTSLQLIHQLALRVSSSCSAIARIVIAVEPIKFATVVADHLPG